MIIISMGAGLGNQMFEYAFYRQIKHLFPEQEVKVDTQYAFPLAHNGIEVFDIFNLDAPIASLDEVRRLASTHYLNGDKFQKKSLTASLLRKARICRSSMLIQNDFSAFDNKFFNLDRVQSYYLYGPFANYHYFQHVEDEIRSLFIFPRINEEKNEKYQELINSSNSVSIHIRKGDYITSGIELVSREFYYNAIQIIEGKIGSASFFVFTDDVSYARELFPETTKFTIIEGNIGRNSYRDMQLMSLCRHNITANSTFSFWGAYLNKHIDKIVIAPNLPFTGLKYPFVCDEWMVIK